MDAVIPGARWVTYFTERGDRNGARARAGDTLFARITPCLENGKVAQVQPEVERCGGSTEFIVLRAGPELLPDYLYVWASSQSTRSVAESLMTGTTGRQRLAPPDMAALRIAVPPLAEQRRIVDLVAAVDAAAEAAVRLADNARNALAAFLADAMSSQEGYPVQILDLLVLSIGGDWGGDLGSSDIDLPVYRQTEFSETGILLRPAGAVRSFSRQRTVRRQLRPGDVLLQKSAGTPSLPGRVVRVPNDIERAIPSNFLHLLRPDPAVCDPAYLFWLLWSTHHEGHALAYQAGTNIRNLDVPRYLGREIALPEIAIQRTIAAAADAFQAEISRTSELQETVARLRAALLADLLSGDHEIPASYDRFLDGAA